MRIEGEWSNESSGLLYFEIADDSVDTGSFRAEGYYQLSGECHPLVGWVKDSVISIVVFWIGGNNPTSFMGVANEASDEIEFTTIERADDCYRMRSDRFIRSVEFEK